MKWCETTQTCQFSLKKLRGGLLRGTRGQKVRYVHQQKKWDYIIILYVFLIIITCQCGSKNMFGWIKTCQVLCHCKRNKTGVNIMRSESCRKTHGSHKVSKIHLSDNLPICVKKFDVYEKKEACTIF